MSEAKTRSRLTVLAHDFPFEHWDLLLETPGELQETISADDLCLLTWRLPFQPARNSECMAERLPMHRRLYLDYEGPVSGNRGMVRQVASTFFQPIRWDDAAGVFELKLSESELGDRLTLIRGSDDRWTCRFSDQDRDPDWTSRRCRLQPIRRSSDCPYRARQEADTSRVDRSVRFLTVAVLIASASVR